jgi:predicted MFS family arabinose efflux permease
VSISARTATRRSLPLSVRLVALAWLLSSTADTFIVFMLFWLAEPQGWSGAEVALVVLATRAPTFLGGVLGGRAVDRFGPVPMLLGDAGLRALLAVGLAVAGMDGTLSLVTVLVLGTASGATAPITYSAVRTLVPRLVPSDQLPRANALLAVGDQLPLLLSAVLIGPSLALLGVGPVFLVPAALLGLAVLVVARVGTGRSAARVHSPAAGDLGAGATASPWRTPGVVPLVALSVCYYAAYGPFEPTLPMFVRTELGAGSGTYSLLWTVFGVAAVLTLPLSVPLAAGRPGVVNGLGALAWGLVTIPFALAGGVPMALVLFAVSGAVWGPYSAIETTALQRWTDPRVHGRLFGTQRALLQTAFPIGAAAGAFALDLTDARTILVASCAGCAAAGAVTLSRRGVWRR